jgi:hypothetical protein
VGGKIRDGPHCQQRTRNIKTALIISSEAFAQDI